MNSGKPDHLPPASCFLDLNWDGPAEISPQYMNCPPEHHQPVRQLVPFSADPEFVERAARLSCFGGGGSGGGGNYGGLAGQLGIRESGKLLRVSSCKSLRVNRPQLEAGNSAEQSSAAVSDPISAGDGESNARKRKAAPKGKSKDTTTKVGDGENLSAKRCRSVEEDEIKPKMEQNGGASSTSGQGGKESNVKPPEPQKDYIHVRARRGQATDNHSLAERVRREKISVRMKLLQDLVPGCNKVTGKALMLDEIINYVQSLQRQVEFLSMKLATVNPRLDFNVETILPKDMHLSNGSMTHSGNPMEASEAGFQYTHPPLMTGALESQFLLNTLEPALHRTLSMQLHALEGFGDAASQLESFWENDLQNVVQMGFGQGQEFASHDQLPADHMKIEL